MQADLAPAQAILFVVFPHHRLILGMCSSKPAGKMATNNSKDAVCKSQQQQPQTKRELILAQSSSASFNVSYIFYLSNFQIWWVTLAVQMKFFSVILLICTVINQ